MGRLTRTELERYDRQIRIPEVGIEGQERLRAARVLVAGAGGLGSPVCTYLAAAGVGTLRIVDGDRIQLGNLNRQVLHTDADVGRPKVHSAAERVARLNPDVDVQPVHEIIDEASVASLARGCDVLVDALDNMMTRLVLNAEAIRSGIPLVHGAISGFEGRVTTVIPGRTACLACSGRTEIPAETFPVIGVAPAVIGGIQACEAIKCILGIGDLLAGRMLVYDGLCQSFTRMKVHRNPDCTCCGSVAAKEPP